MDCSGLLVMTAAYGAFIKWLPDGEVGWRNALIGGGVASRCSLLAGIYAGYTSHMLQPQAASARQAR
jgi:hypothetical protein